MQAEIAHDWGGSQRILGPCLIVPYTVKAQRLVDGKAVDVEVTREAVFLPDTLNVSGNVQTQMRHRSIYDVTVYQGKLTLEGRYRPVDLSLVEPETPTLIRWQDAFIALGIQESVPAGGLLCATRARAEIRLFVRGGGVWRGVRA